MQTSDYKKAQVPSVITMSKHCFMGRETMQNVYGGRGYNMVKYQSKGAVNWIFKELCLALGNMPPTHN